MKKVLFFLLPLFSVSIVALAQPSPIAVKKSTTRHGPEKGSLIIIGGNVGSTASIWNKFTELAPSSF